MKDIVRPDHLIKKDSFKCPILDITELCENLFSVTVKSPELASGAVPGQFLHIACGDGHILRRPISICDVEGDIVRFLFEIRGEGTRVLADRRAGDLLDILGPLGRGYDTRGVESALVIGGGIGVYPLLLTARSIDGTCDGALGFRSACRVVLKKEFSTLCRSLEITTDDGSEGQKGLVTAAARKLLENNRYNKIFACGPAVMLKEVKRLSQEFSISCEISMEQRMGCGIGGCLVCVCKTKGADGQQNYSRVCRDGPVFDAKEVVFDEA